MIVGLVATGRGVAVSVRRCDMEGFKHFHEDIAPTRKVVKALEIDEGSWSETFHVSMKDIEDAMKIQRRREIEERIALLQAELESLE